MNKEEYISQLMHFNRETGKPENLYTEKYVTELQNRISKAIDKLNNMKDTYYESNMANDMQNIFDLLDILKGVDKE